MGVLEDAIRDHLQLKRKHGASEEEVEQKEEEALGPARREFEAPAEDSSEDGSTVEEHAPAEAEAGAEPEPEIEEEAEGATQVHESPPVVPPADEAQSPDFTDDDGEPDHLWSEQKPQRDLDFD